MRLLPYHLGRKASRPNGSQVSLVRATAPLLSCRRSIVPSARCLLVEPETAADLFFCSSPLPTHQPYRVDSPAVTAESLRGIRIELI